MKMLYRIVKPLLEKGKIRIKEGGMERMMFERIGKAAIDLMLIILLVAASVLIIKHSPVKANTLYSFLGENSVSNSAFNAVPLQAGPPPSGNWILLVTDPDEGVGTSLMAVYGQLYSSVIYFRVEHWRLWTTITDTDNGIFIDADQNPSTGLPDGYYPGQNTGIGADYLIVVGYEATAMWRWDPVTNWWDTANPISLAYLDAPDYTNVFVVGVYLSDIQTSGSINGAVCDIPSGWDWMPDTGHFTLNLGLGGWYYVRTYHPNQWVGGGFSMGWHADDSAWEFALPFAFPFYGTYYSTIYISSNGLITFTGPDSSYENSISELATRLAIAPAWDDWVTYEPFDIYIWQPDPDHVIIRWEVQAYGSSTRANFEVILGVDGVIQFNYGYNDGPVSATVGISNGVNDILAEDLANLNYINSIKFTPIIGGPAFGSIAYVYCSWGMWTMQDEINYLNTLDPNRYQFVWYNEENIDTLWLNLNSYRALLIDEDTFYSDPSWTEYGGPIYTSFRQHANELASWVINGGGIFTSGENDLMRSQTWDWLPPGMQVRSFDPELTSSVHIVYDPGLYSTPNVITNGYLSGGHTHAYFINWDQGYSVTVRRDDNDQPIELFGVFGRGVIVVSHIEAEDMYLAWEYMQNQLEYISPAYPPWILTILEPAEGATYYVNDIVTITAYIYDPDTGTPGTGATVTANSPTGSTLILTEVSPGIYTTTYQVAPTDPSGPWTINVVGIIGGRFPKDTVTVNLITPNIHDVAVTSVTSLKTVVGQGYSMNVNVTVANQGDYTETFDVTIYAGSGQPLNETGLVGYWSFDEGTGTTAYDSSGNNNHGTIYGATWTNGKIGNALQFDGIDDYVFIENSPSLQVSQSITITAWTKVEETTGDHQIILAKWYPSPSYVLEMQPDGQTPQLAIVNSAGTVIYAISNIAIPIGEWAHITGTYDGLNVKIYVNGILTGTSELCGPINIGDQPVLIGAHAVEWDRNWFNGIIDEVKIYNRALSAEEVWAEYTRTGARYTIGTQTVTLESGASTTLTFTWNTTGFAKGNYTLWVYAWPVQGETDTADNTLYDGTVYVGVPCDITGPIEGVPDGICNMRDIGYICRRFGTTPSSPNWDPNADVTGPTPKTPDNIVNMRDVGEACRNFGQQDP
ncbi:MAG: LamG domain-containing protein [Candidatus Bathyarchaeia archaeon]